MSEDTPNRIVGLEGDAMIVDDPLGILANETPFTGRPIPTPTWLVEQEMLDEMRRSADLSIDAQVARYHENVARERQRIAEHFGDAVAGVESRVFLNPPYAKAEEWTRQFMQHPVAQSDDRVDAALYAMQFQQLQAMPPMSEAEAAELRGRLVETRGAVEVQARPGLVPGQGFSVDQHGFATSVGNGSVVGRVVRVNPDGTALVQIDYGIGRVVAMTAEERRTARRLARRRRRGKRDLWRMGRMRMQGGAVEQLAQRYAIGFVRLSRKATHGYQRSDIRRWKRLSRDVFAVASDLLEGGERVRAIELLLDVVHVRDAIEITRCGGIDTLMAWAAPGEHGKKFAKLRSYDPAKVRVSFNGVELEAFSVEQQDIVERHPSLIETIDHCERCGSHRSEIQLAEFSVQRARSAVEERRAAHPRAEFIVEVLCEPCGEQATNLGAEWAPVGDELYRIRDCARCGDAHRAVDMFEHDDSDEPLCATCFDHAHRHGIDG